MIKNKSSTDSVLDKSSLQFFLFKGERVVKVLVNFIDPSFKGMFDKILGSIRLGETPLRE